MFIPRKVSRPNDVTRRLAATRPEFVQESTILQEDLKGKGKTIEAPCAASEELAALVHLALSKHSIWVNPELISSDNGCTYNAQPSQHPSLELIAVRQTCPWFASFANPTVSRAWKRRLSKWTSSGQSKNICLTPSRLGSSSHLRKSPPGTPPALVPMRPVDMKYVAKTGNPFVQLWCRYGSATGTPKPCIWCVSNLLLSSRPP